MIARNNPVPIARTPIQSRSGAFVCGVAAGRAGPSGAAPVGFRRPSEIRASPPRRSVSARVIDGALSFQKEPFAETRFPGILAARVRPAHSFRQLTRTGGANPQLAPGRERLRGGGGYPPRAPPRGKKGGGGRKKRKEESPPPPRRTQANKRGGWGQTTGKRCPPPRPVPGRGRRPGSPLQPQPRQKSRPAACCTKVERMPAEGCGIRRGCFQPP